MTTTPPWPSRAICRADPSQWDERLDPAPGQRPETEPERVGRWKRAIGICLGHCPVQPECLDDRMRSPHRPGGVRGGRLFREGRTEPVAVLRTCTGQQAQ